MPGGGVVRREWRLLLQGLCGAALTLSLADRSRAQVALPEIRVTAPSPIVRRTPAPPSGSVVPGPDDTDTAPASEASLPGTLPIVTDQFATVTVLPSEELRRSVGGTLG